MMCSRAARRFSLGVNKLAVGRVTGRAQAVCHFSQTNRAIDDTDAKTPKEGPNKLEIINRHGAGDARVTLSVGGKKFHTLRSTVNCNAVLMDQVARAKANNDITLDGDVFIDRDPKHFGFILQYLRNKADGVKVGANPNVKTGLKDADVVLPKDTTDLQELYHEAKFYDMSDLQTALATKSIFATVRSFFSKSFSPLSKLFT
jgi:hypothetical protein